MRVFLAIALLAIGCAKEPSSPWQPLPLNTSADFRDLYFADSQNGWIAGGAYDIPGGLIGRTRDGGKTWQLTSGILSPHRMATGLKVEALHFFDTQRGIAATDGGKIYTTRDGGENWGEVRGWTGATDYLFDLEFLDERVGWAFGLDGVLFTSDGGEKWFRLGEEPRGKRLGGRAMAMLDRNNGWFIGQHALAMRTRDGAKTWTRAELPLPADERPDFWDVFFIDERHGWITGDEGTLLFTDDGGNTWQRRELGIEGVRSAPKLERIRRGNKVDVIDAGDRTPGLTLASIRFADPQNGWIVGLFANMGRSLILRTTDGGATWAVEADIEGEELRNVFVLDADHVWAIGARTRPGQQAIYFRGASSN